MIREWTVDREHTDYRVARSLEVLPPALVSPVLRVPLRASRQAVLALCAAHGLAAAAVATVGMPPALGVAGVLALGVHALIQIRRHAGLPGGEGISTFEVRGTTQLRMERGDGGHEDWEIVAAPLVTPPAVLLMLRRADGTRRSLWLPGDACPEDAHRQLRVLLRWRVHSEPRAERPV